MNSMKNVILSVFALFSLLSHSQAYVDSYYDYEEISGLRGKALKTYLKELLKKTHVTRGYGELLYAYFESDRDVDHDGDGTIVDMYSENTHGQDPYVYSSEHQFCGQGRGYKKESDCLNREHLFPQGIFRKRFPMKSDFFHVYPSDGYVNNKRGNLPFGEVSEVSWASQNGSKVGWSASFDYGGKVFEPIDEFKGDIARAMLYFAIRYQDKVTAWHHEILDGSSFQVYESWFFETLLRWHKQDPVSDHEVRRNNVGFIFQGNRNPLIDHPEWVSKIWE